MNLSSFYSVSNVLSPRTASIAYTQAPMLELHGLSKAYRDSACTLKPALHGISLTVRRGESVSVLGPAGSGKSTLLNLLGCLDTPSSGRYFCDGVNVENLDATARARLRQRAIGFIFRAPHLLARMSVLDNVSLALAYGEMSRGKQREAALAALQRAGVADLAERTPQQLDAAQQQRVAIARALVNDAPILLADEPTGTLGEAETQAILALLQRQCDAGRSVVLVTANAAVAAQADRQFVLRDGRLYTPHASEPLV